MSSNNTPLLDVMKLRNKLKENSAAKSKMVENDISSVLNSSSSENGKIVTMNGKSADTDDVPSMAVTMVRNHLDRDKIAHSHFSNQYLQRFVDAENDNPSKAAIHIKDYLDMKRSHPQFFLRPSQVVAKFKQPVFYFQRERTPSNQFIMYARPANWQYDEHLLADTLATLIPFVECETLLNKASAGKGPVVLVDMTGWTYTHFSKIRKFDLEFIMDIAEKLSPAKPGPVHVFNVISSVTAVYKMLKPFLSERLSRDMYLYSSDELPKLYDIIPKSQLPKELGGECDLRKFCDSELKTYDQLLVDNHY